MATFIRQGIHYGRKNIKGNVEAVAIEIFDQTKSVYNIVNLYIPPKSETTDNINQLFTYPNLILTGDLNAKNTLWGAPRDDARGKIIEKLIEENNLVILNNGRGD